MPFKRLASALLIVFVFALSWPVGDSPNPISNNPLHWAARKNDLATARDLLDENPKLLDSVDSDHRTALHYAAAAGAIEVLKLLIDRHANLNQQTSVGVTPLLWAMEYRDFEGFRILIKHRANLELARHDDGRVSFTALSAALHDGLDDYAKPLVEAGANVNVRDEAGWTPLLHATFASRPVAIIRLLLDRGAEVNAKNEGGNGPLSHSLLRGNYEVAQELLRRGADITATGFDNMRWHDNCQMNSAGWAARGGDIECMKLVLAHGGDPRLRDGEGRDALQIAREHRLPAMEAFISEVLLKQGRGWTPRHFAADFGIREALGEPGPPLDTPTQDGLTPLMLAAAHGDIPTAELLLRSGCDPRRIGDRGESAVDIARRLGQPSMVKLLLSDSPLRRR